MSSIKDSSGADSSDVTPVPYPASEMASPQKGTPGEINFSTCDDVLKPPTSSTIANAVASSIYSGVTKERLGFLQLRTTVFMCCDMQEKFRPAIKHFKEIIQTSGKLVDLSKILNIPLIVTEQYPKGLGSTASELRISHAIGIYSKTKFSMMIPEVLQALNTVCNGKASSIVLFGLEAHVCVEQTAIELIDKGYIVHVVADATSSRSQEDRQLAFCRLQQIGCFISTQESILFKLVQDKESQYFNDIKPLVKETSPNTGLVKL